MSVSLQVVLGVVIAVGLALVLFRRRREAPPPRTVALTGDLTARLRALVAEGSREDTGRQLEESKA